jgi:hypothetical protein
MNKCKKHTESLQWWLLFTKLAAKILPEKFLNKKPTDTFIL